MPDFSLFLDGLAVGFIIATPVGPIGMLCIRRILVEGRLAGLLSGLGASTADGIFAAFAAFGLGIAPGLFAGHQSWLRAGSGILLLALGLRVFRTRPALRPDPVKAGGLVRCYASILALTLMNPAILLTLAAVFAGLGLTAGETGRLSAVFLVAGVFCGSAVWWVTLSLLVGRLSGLITLRWLLWVNRTAGAAVGTFGAAILVSLVF